MLPSLSAGFIKQIVDGIEVPNPIIQVLGYKKIAGNGERYRFGISDGAMYSPFAMLGSQLNYMIDNKELEKFTIVQVEKCSCNVQNEKKIIILLELKVLVPGSTVGKRIGDPVHIAQPNNQAEMNAVNAPTVPSTTMEESTRDLSATTNATPAENAFKRNTFYRGNQSHSTSYSSNSNNNTNNEGDMNIHPIVSLTPYQNKWTVKVRVTNKSAIRHWSNSRSEGKLFSMDLLDESGQIRATGFNEAVDKFYDAIEINQIYLISRGTLKTANKQFTSIRNEYEMSLNSETTIIPCNDVAPNIPMLQFNFIPIGQIEQVEKDTTIDVIGVCKTSSDLTKITTRFNNKEVSKREIRLVDTSNTEVALTLWGDDAEKFEPSNNPVVAVKEARVSDFGGRSLSVLRSSVLQINPDIREAHILKGWFDKEGSKMEAQTISTRGNAGSAGGMGGTWKTFAQANSENLGLGEKPDYYTTKAIVSLLRKENCMYMACPSADCNKKIIDLNNGMFRCEKCNAETPNFKWRLLLSMSIADFTENVWVTCFQEAAEIILGVTSQELGSYKEQQVEMFNDVLDEVNCKSFIFRLRTKMDTFNEESRLKTTVMSATPVDPLVYARKLLVDIKQYQQVL